MRLVTYDEGSIGVVVDGDVVDLTDLVDGQAASWPPLQMVRLIAEFDTLRDEVEQRSRTASRTPLSDVTLQTPVQWPSKLIGMPANYQQHIEEMRSKNRAYFNGFFLKAPSSLSGPADPIVLPRLGGVQIDHESELAVVIGRRGRHIDAADALDHVFGYSCLVDVTVRSQQERVTRKSFDTFAPMGPWIVTREELPDPGNLDIRLSVNGDLRQDANTSGLIVTVPEIIAMVSSVCTLEPGDVIATGSPAGVGPLVEGDRVAITVEGVGSMALDVTRASQAAYPLGWDQPRP